MKQSRIEAMSKYRVLWTLTVHNIILLSWAHIVHFTWFNLTWFLFLQFEKAQKIAYKNPSTGYTNGLLALTQNIDIYFKQ